MRPSTCPRPTETRRGPSGNAHTQAQTCTHLRVIGYGRPRSCIHDVAIHKKLEAHTTHGTGHIQGNKLSHSSAAEWRTISTQKVQQLVLKNDSQQTEDQATKLPDTRRSQASAGAAVDSKTLVQESTPARACMRRRCDSQQQQRKVSSQAHDEQLEKTVETP